MDRNSHPPGICQKLINFFLLRLRPLPASAGIPIGKGSSIAGTDAEIAVDFRHTDEHRGYSIHSHGEDGLISGTDQAKLQNGSEGNGFRARSGGGNGPKKTVAIEGSDHQEIPVHDRHHPDDHETKQRPTQHWPLLSVASNIDKKSDEFIERKKRAMGMNYSLDPVS